MTFVDALPFLFDVAPLVLAPAGLWMLYRLYKLQGQITRGARNWLVVVSFAATLAVASTLVDLIFEPSDEVGTFVDLTRISGLAVVLLPVLLTYLVPERDSHM